MESEFGKEELYLQIIYKMLPLNLERFDIANFNNLREMY